MEQPSFELSYNHVVDGDPSATASQLTELLECWNRGEAGALDQVVDAVYSELRRLAGSILRNERDGHTLQATALVHEAYLRLVDYRSPQWSSRKHFLNFAASQMRDILVDYARRRDAQKRTPLHPVGAIGANPGPNMLNVSLVAVDLALKQLEILDPGQGRIVELRFFGGLTNEETAEVTELSVRTVKREWHSAKAWLYQRLKDSAHHDSGTIL